MCSPDTSVLPQKQAEHCYLGSMKRLVRCLHDASSPRQRRILFLSSFAACRHGARSVSHFSRAAFHNSDRNMLRLTSGHFRLQSPGGLIQMGVKQASNTLPPVSFITHLVTHALHSSVAGLYSVAQRGAAATAARNVAVTTSLFSE